MNLWKWKWNRLSLTGRFCFVFLCVEAYLTACYPQKDWTPVSKRMWPWTKTYWTEGWDRYSVVVPEWLFEFEGYEETNVSFKGRLSRWEYEELLRLYDGITKGDSEDEINQVLLLPIEFCNACEGCCISQACELTEWIFHQLRGILEQHEIPLPDLGRVRKFPLCRREEFGDSEALSMVLHS